MMSPLISTASTRFWPKSLAVKTPYAVLATRRLDTDAHAGAEQVVTRALASARALLADEGAAAKVTAVGVVSPGIVLPEEIQEMFPLLFRQLWGQHVRIGRLLGAGRGGQ